ncbi:hypothetical protein HDV05_005440 [Chytridiales sp. JEL 0842]|nr:hypothetical protein HDV05_005440 [Chytridiales sp. JEL 0842]
MDNSLLPSELMTDQEFNEAHDSSYSLQNQEFSIQMSPQHLKMGKGASAQPHEIMPAFLEHSRSYLSSADTADNSYDEFMASSGSPVGVAVAAEAVSSDALNAHFSSQPWDSALPIDIVGLPSVAMPNGFTLGDSHGMSTVIPGNLKKKGRKRGPPKGKGGNSNMPLPLPLPGQTNQPAGQGSGITSNVVNTTTTTTTFTSTTTAASDTTSTADASSSLLHMVASSADGPLAGSRVPRKRGRPPKRSLQINTMHSFSTDQITPPIDSSRGVSLPSYSFPFLLSSTLPLGLNPEAIRQGHEEINKRRKHNRKKVVKPTVAPVEPVAPAVVTEATEEAVKSNSRDTTLSPGPTIRELPQSIAKDLAPLFNGNKNESGKSNSSLPTPVETSSQEEYILQHNTTGGDLQHFVRSETNNVEESMQMPHPENVGPFHGAYPTGGDQETPSIDPSTLFHLPFDLGQPDSFHHHPHPNGAIHQGHYFMDFENPHMIHNGGHPMMNPAEMGNMPYHQFILGIDGFNGAHPGKPIFHPGAHMDDPAGYMPSIEIDSLLPGHASGAHPDFLSGPMVGHTSHSYSPDLSPFPPHMMHPHHAAHLHHHPTPRHHPHPPHPFFPPHPPHATHIPSRGYTPPNNGAYPEFQYSLHPDMHPVSIPGPQPPQPGGGGKQVGPGRPPNSGKRPYNKKPKEPTTTTATTTTTTAEDGSVIAPAAEPTLDAEGNPIPPPVPVTNGKKPHSGKHRPNFSAEVIAMLLAWFEANMNNPYPTQEVKEAFAIQTGLTIKQVNDWFINARRRKMPMAQ